MKPAMARERAGLTLKQAARRARIGERYLRSIELHGNASFALARRLSRIYHCPIDLFL